MKRNVLLAAVGLCAAILSVPSSAVAATTLTLVDPAPANQQYQQTLNSPCVVGESSCKNPAGFVQGDIPNGSPSEYDVTSPGYTVAQITALVGNAPIVGIDINTTTTPTATEVLMDFMVYKTVGAVTTLIFEYHSASPLIVANNGNGYADALLTGLDFSTLNATDVITFRAHVNNATDGKEEFFLINGSVPPPVIPEPATLSLLGGGLLAVARSVRRRRATSVA